MFLHSQEDAIQGRSKTEARFGQADV